MHIVSSINIVKWIEFVKNHPNGNIFQTPQMFEVYKKTKDYYPFLIAVEKKGVVLGVMLSVVIKNSNSLMQYFTARSIIRGGPIVFNNDSNVLDLILKEYNRKVGLTTIYTQFRNLWDWKNLKYTFKENGFSYDEHLDIHFDLTKGRELLWEEMARVRKKSIKQSYRKGVLIKKIDISYEDTLKSSYSIIESVYKRIGLPLPSIDFFRNMVYIQGDNLLTLGLFVEEKLVAVRFLLCYKSNIYDWFAGARNEYLNYRPNDVLPWEAMMWGIKNNFNSFSFGGAGKPHIPYGVRDHKMKFGGSLVEFGRFEIIHKPFLMYLAKFGLKMYKLIK